MLSHLSAVGRKQAQNLALVQAEDTLDEEAEPVFFSFLSGLRITKKAELEKVRAELLGKYGARYKIKNFDEKEVVNKFT